MSSTSIAAATAAATSSVPRPDPEREDGSPPSPAEQKAALLRHPRQTEADGVEVFVKRLRGLRPRDVKRVELRLVKELFPSVEVVRACLVKPHAWNKVFFPRNTPIAEVAQHYVQVVFWTKDEEDWQLILPMRVVMAQEEAASLPARTPLFKDVSLWRWGDPAGGGDVEGAGDHDGGASSGRKTSGSSEKNDCRICVRFVPGTVVLPETWWTDGIADLPSEGNHIFKQRLNLAASVQEIPLEEDGRFRDWRGQLLDAGGGRRSSSSSSTAGGGEDEEMSPPGPLVAAVTDAATALGRVAQKVDLNAALDRDVWTRHLQRSLSHAARPFFADGKRSEQWKRVEDGAYHVLERSDDLFEQFRREIAAAQGDALFEIRGLEASGPGSVLFEGTAAGQSRAKTSAEVRKQQEKFRKKAAAAAESWAAEYVALAGDATRVQAMAKNVPVYLRPPEGTCVVPVNETSASLPPGAGGATGTANEPPAAPPIGALQEFTKMWAKAKLDQLGQEFEEEVAGLRADKMTEEQKAAIVQEEEEYGRQRKEAKRRGTARWIRFWFPKKKAGASATEMNHKRGSSVEDEESRQSTFSSGRPGPDFRAALQRDLTDASEELVQFAERFGLVVDPATRHILWVAPAEERQSPFDGSTTTEALRREMRNREQREFADSASERIPELDDYPIEQQHERLLCANGVVVRKGSPLHRVFSQAQRVNPEYVYLCVFRDADFEADPIDDVLSSDESEGGAEDLVEEVAASGGGGGKASGEDDLHRKELDYLARGGLKDERPKTDAEMEQIALRDILSRPKKATAGAGPLSSPTSAVGAAPSSFADDDANHKTHRLLSQLHADLVVLGTIQRKMLQEQKTAGARTMSPSPGGSRPDGGFNNLQAGAPAGAPPPPATAKGPKFKDRDLLEVSGEHQKMLSSWDPVERRFWELQKAQMEQLNRDMFLSPDGILAEAEISGGGQIRTLGRFEFDIPYRVLLERKETFLAAVRNELAEFSACHRDHIELLLTDGDRPLHPDEAKKFGEEALRQQGGMKPMAAKKKIPLLHVRGPARFLNCERFQEHQASVKKNRLFRAEVCTFLPDPLAKLELGASGPVRVLANENVRLRDRLADVTNHAYYLEIFQKLCGQYEKAIDALRLKDEVLPELQRLQPVLVRDANDGREKPSQILQKLFRQGVVGMPDWIDELPNAGGKSFKKGQTGEGPEGLFDALPSGAGGINRGKAVREGESAADPPAVEEGQDEPEQPGGGGEQEEQTASEKRAARRRVPGSTKLASNELGSKYQTIGEVLGEDEEKVFVLAVFLRSATSVPQADAFSLSDPYVQVRLKLRAPGDRIVPWEDIELRAGDIVPEGYEDEITAFQYISPSVDLLDPDDYTDNKFLNRRAIGNTRYLDDTEFPEWTQVVEIECREMDVRFDDLHVELCVIDSNGPFSLSDTPIGKADFELCDYCEGPAQILQYQNGARVKQGVAKSAVKMLRGLVTGGGDAAAKPVAVKLLDPKDDPSIVDPTLCYAENPSLVHREYKLHTLPVRPLVVLEDEGQTLPKVDTRFDLDRCKISFCCMWSVQDLRLREARRKAAESPGILQSLMSMFTGAGEDEGVEEDVEGDAGVGGEEEGGAGGENKEEVELDLAAGRGEDGAGADGKQGAEEGKAPEDG